MLRVYTRPVNQLRQDMNRIFGDVFSECCEKAESSAAADSPVIDVWEEVDHFTVEAALPGVERDAVEIHALGRKLTVKGQWRPAAKVEEAGPEQGETVARKYYNRERPVGPFQRVLAFPTDIDSERVEAHLHNGLLTITVPKAASAKPRKIELKSD